MLTSLFKDAIVSPLPNLQRVFQLWKSIDLNSAWVDIFNDVNLLFPLLFSRVKLCGTLEHLASGSLTMLTGLLKILVLALSLIYTCIFLLVGVFRFGQCLGKRFSPISNFFSLVSFRAFRDAPHSRFRRGDFKVC